MDHTNEQQKVLEQRRQEIAEQVMVETRQEIQSNLVIINGINTVMKGICFSIFKQQEGM